MVQLKPHKARFITFFDTGSPEVPKLSDRSNVDIGELCLSYGGGGHKNAGTCQRDNDRVDAELPTIIAALNA